MIVSSPNLAKANSFENFADAFLEWILVTTFTTYSGLVFMSFAIRVIKPSSFLSVAATNLFHTEIKKAIASNAAIVLVDFERIPSMSSANFLTLVKALKLVRSSGCKLFLCSLSQQIKMLFELTGLDQVITTFADADEFAAYVQMQRSTVEVPRQTKIELEATPIDALKLAS
jgi:anti-anti-sigma factor